MRNIRAWLPACFAVVAIPDSLGSYYSAPAQRYGTSAVEKGQTWLTSAPGTSDLRVS
jgi:hypothetical protein